MQANRSLLTQVFSNLFQNAITYRKENVPLRLHVSCRIEGPKAIICVNDNGIGIDPSVQNRIFEIFERLHRGDEYPGTGIELANVKRAAELQGGSIWVESEPGNGSSFCIELNAAG